MRGGFLLALAVVPLTVACASPASVPSATTIVVPAPVATAPVAVTRGAVFAVARGDGVATVRIREQLVGWTVPDAAILTSDDVSGTFGLLDDGTFDPASSLSISLATITSDESIRADAARKTILTTPLRRRATSSVL